MREASIDAFHRGRFVLAQPKSGAHRAGMDAMALAAAVPSNFGGVVADLGAGAGAAALAVLSRCPQARALLVENAAEMAAFARASLARPENAWLAARAEVIDADVALAGAARAAAGLVDRSVDLAMMNPPFNDPRDRTTPKALKAHAHVPSEGGLAPWLRTAAAMVKPGGLFAAILRPEQIGDVLDAASGRFGGLVVKPVHASADSPAIRIVVRGARGSRARLSLAPALILRRDSASTPEAEAIINGAATLFGD